MFAVPATRQQPKCPCVHDEVTWTRASYPERSDARCRGQTLTKLPLMHFRCDDQRRWSNSGNRLVAEVGWQRSSTCFRLIPVSRDTQTGWRRRPTPLLRNSRRHPAAVLLAAATHQRCARRGAERLLPTRAIGSSRPKPEDQASPKLPDARTDHVWAGCPRSSHSWPPGPRHQQPVSWRSKVRSRLTSEGRLCQDKSAPLVSSTRPATAPSSGGVKLVAVMEAVAAEIAQRQNQTEAVADERRPDAQRSRQPRT